MSKPKTPRRLKNNEAQAVARLLRISPQKLNLVAQMIRGKKANVAVADLTFSQKRIAGQVLKTLRSAIANAENNHSLDIDNLVVAQATVGRGLVMGRFHARGRGKAAAIERPFSHLTIVVRQVDAEEEKKKNAKKPRNPKKAETTKKKAA
jgi:large subunit ribosomal protein L22